MDRIFGRSEDNYLRGVIFYADSEAQIWEDSAFDKIIDKKAVESAFLKNMISIVNDGKYLKPTALNTQSRIIECVTNDIDSVKVLTFTY